MARRDDLRTREGRERKPELLAQALSLREQGLRLDEIAERLRTSPGTVSAMLPPFMVHLSPRELARRRAAYAASHHPYHSSDTVPRPDQETDSMTPEQEQQIREGFADRVAREATEETERIVAELDRLRFDAIQVERVLRGLALPVPYDLLVAIGKVPLDEDGRSTAAAEPLDEPEAPEADTPPGFDDLPSPAAPLVGYQREVGAQNAQKVVDWLEENGPARLGAIVQGVGLAKGNTSRHLSKLEEEGLVIHVNSAWDVAGRTTPRLAPPKPGLPKPEAETDDRKVAKPPRKSPTFTGEVPEHLRHMPAAKGRGPLGSRTAAAEKQLTVFNDVQEHGPVVKTETMRRTGLPEHIVAAALRTLDDAGLLQRTGRNRFDSDKVNKGGHKGRTGVEYDVLPPDERPVAEPPVAPTTPVPEPQAEQTPEPPQDRTADLTYMEAVAVVRDNVTRRVGVFGPSEIAEQVQLDVETVTDCLNELVRHGTLRDESPSDDLRLYEFAKPEGPGRAAELDAQRPTGDTTNGSGGGAPVAGTGRGLRTGNKLSQVLVDQCVKAGASAEKVGNGHIAIMANGKRVLISSTPRSESSVQGERSRVRRILGLGV